MDDWVIIAIVLSLGLPAVIGFFVALLRMSDFRKWVMNTTDRLLFNKKNKSYETKNNNKSARKRK